MAGYLGTTDAFETAMGVRTAYADSNQVDYERLVDAIAHGPIVAESGVYRAPCPPTENVCAEIPCRSGPGRVLSLFRLWIT